MAMLCDMVGELCNVILGRFRNCLLRRGVAVACATPTTVLGQVGEIRCAPAQHSAWRAFRSTAGDVYLRLDLSFEPSFKLPGPEVIEPTIEDLMLF
jgi:hypothetical protein